MLAVILAGGRSERMGKDKGMLLWEGELLVSVLERRYAGALGGAVLSADRTDRYPGLPVLADLRAGKGPLAGLETVFTRTKAETVFLTAVDLPFGDPALALLLERLGKGHDVCVIRREKGLEPAFAVYRRSCLAAISACLDEEKHSFRALFDRVAVREVREEELCGWDLDRILFNMNRPEDYEQAKAILAGD